MQEKTTAKDVTGSLNGGYWMLDFIEFKAGQKQPMATYPFTFCNLSERAVRGKDELPGRARKSAYVVSVVDLFSRRNRAGTRIFSPLAVAGLCVTIGRYCYLIQAFNGGLSRSILPIRTHSVT